MSWKIIRGFKGDGFVSLFVFTPNFIARRNPACGKTYAAKCDFCNFFVKLYFKNTIKI